MSRLTLTLACNLLTLALLLSAGQAWAHGVRGLIGTNETICATATYDDGEPMSYGAVEIAAPDSKLPFQSGRSDRNGLFCFRPDSPGQWQLTINDEMGHQVRLQTTVDQDMAQVPSKADHEHNGQSIGRVNGIVSGIALIFGMTGGLAWWKSRKKLTEFKAGYSI